ncbi:hypothetical protein KCP77_21805 [Salmonella enterica subsp. enterica]|nr:hypothetical protein KCP77_21805 [Salmonella enterica subsp. enterica]
MATLIHAGLTLSEGLELLAKQHPPPTMASAVAHAGSRANRASLFQRISLGRRYFPPLYQTMITGK